MKRKEGYYFVKFRECPEEWTIGFYSSTWDNWQLVGIAKTFHEFYLSEINEEMIKTPPTK